MLEVSCQFQREQIGYDFQLQLPVGRTLLVTGESGAGKSTLLDVIAGYHPMAGVHFMQQDWSSLPVQQRACTLLMQKDNLFEHLTSWQNMALALKANLKLTPQQQQQLQQVAQELQIDDLLHKKPPQLSGGQNQRVALARCLLADRPLLLLDEPFAALAKPARQKALLLLQSLAKKQGWTLVLVSHQPEECRFMADYEVEIVAGKTQQRQAISA